MSFDHLKAGFRRSGFQSQDSSGFFWDMLNILQSFVWYIKVIFGFPFKTVVNYIQAFGGRLNYSSVLGNFFTVSMRFSPMYFLELIRIISDSVPIDIPGNCNKNKERKRFQCCGIVSISLCDDLGSFFLPLKFLQIKWEIIFSWQLIEFQTLISYQTV